MRLYSGEWPGLRAIPLDLDEPSEYLIIDDQMLGCFDATTFGSWEPHTDWDGAAMAPIEQAEFVAKGGGADA